MRRFAWFSVVLATAVAGIAVLLLAFGRSDETRLPPDPGAVGMEIADFYQQMIGDTAQAVTQATSPAALGPRLATIRDRYVDLFTKAGRRRERLGAADRQAADSAEYSEMLGVPESELQVIRQYAAAHRQTDPALAAELESMLRLETRANFDERGAWHARPAPRVGTT